MKKRKKKSNKNYFTSDTEEAIIKYLELEDEREKNKIFEKEIYYPFFKLSQNIIHTFKFYYLNSETIEELQHELMIFVYEKLNKYHPGLNIHKRIKKLEKEGCLKDLGNFIEYINNKKRINQKDIDEYLEKYVEYDIHLSKECMGKIKRLTPPKAYSYFGTIIKRYLITYNNNNYKKLKNNDEVSLWNDDEKLSYELDIEENTFLFSFLKYLKNNKNFFVKKEEEEKILNSIIYLLSNIDLIDIFNKKAIYLYLREITNCSTSSITKVLKRIKNKYYLLLNEYNDKGNIDFYL